MVQNKVLGFLLLIIFFPFFCFAQELTLEQTSDYNEIVGSVMSPFCPGKLLHDCPTEKASELKNLVKEKLVKGQSKDSVLIYLQDQFGKETLSSAPESSGFGAFAWYAPGVFFVLSVVIYLFWIKFIDVKSVTNIDVYNVLSEELKETEKRILEELGRKN